MPQEGPSWAGARNPHPLGTAGGPAAPEERQRTKPGPPVLGGPPRSQGASLVPGAMSHQARRFPGLPHPQLWSPHTRQHWAHVSPLYSTVTDRVAQGPQTGGGARCPGDPGTGDPGATSLVSEVGPPTEALERGRHRFSSTFRHSGKRNPRPVLRLCHLLENRSKSSDFHGVESLNQAERGPRTGVTRGGSRKKHRDIVPQTEKWQSSRKEPKVVERSDLMETSEELP